MGAADSLATSPRTLEAKNNANLQAVLALAESDGWEEVTSRSGVTVSRKFMQPAPPSPRVSSSASSGGGGGEAGGAAHEGRG